jgi:hypothetical protein
METKTRSQLFPDKEYDTLINELEEGDFDLKSEMYKVTVFNKVIHVSPGNVIKDERIATLYYCYVYVIINKRVKAKLGLYEKIIEGKDIPEQFDISEFDAGSMLVFDDYYKDPKILNDFEIVEKVEAEDDNVFLYLQRHIVPDVTKENAKIHSGRVTKVYDMIGKNKEKQKEYTKMFEKYLKYFKDLEKFNDDFMEKLESSDLKPFNLMFILSILEYYFSVKFIFVDENLALIDDTEIRNVFNTRKYTEIIVINAKTENIVERTEDISQLKTLIDKFKKNTQAVVAVVEGQEEEEEEEEKGEDEEEGKGEVVVKDEKKVSKASKELEEGEISDEDEEELSATSKLKNKTLLAESKSSEFDTTVETGMAEPSEKLSKVSFKGTVLKPKVKASSVKASSVESSKPSTLLTGTVKPSKQLSGIDEEDEEASAEKVKVKSSKSKPVVVEEPVKEKKKSSKSKPAEEVVEEPVKEKKKSSKSKPAEEVVEDVSAKPKKKSSSSKTVEEPSSAKPKKKSSSSKTVEEPTSSKSKKSITPDQQAYMNKVKELASLLPTKSKSGKSKPSRDE